MNIKWTIMGKPVLISKLQDRCYGITMYPSRALVLMMNKMVGWIHDIWGSSKLSGKSSPTVRALDRYMVYLLVGVQSENCRPIFLFLRPWLIIRYFYIKGHSEIPLKVHKICFVCLSFAQWIVLKTCVAIYALLCACKILRSSENSRDGDATLLTWKITILTWN